MNAKTIEEYYAMDPDKPFDAQAWANDHKNYACDLSNRFMPTAPPQTVTQAQAEANVFVKTHLEMNKLLERKNTLTQSIVKLRESFREQAEAINLRANSLTDSSTQSIVKFREPSEYNESFEDAHEITQLAYDNITTNWYLGTEPISYTGGRPQQIIRK